MPLPPGFPRCRVHHMIDPEEDGLPRATSDPSAGQQASRQAGGPPGDAQPRLVLEPSLIVGERLDERRHAEMRIVCECLCVVALWRADIKKAWRVRRDHCDRRCEPRSRVNVDAGIQASVQDISAAKKPLSLGACRPFAVVPEVQSFDSGFSEYVVDPSERMCLATVLRRLTGDAHEDQRAPAARVALNKPRYAGIAPDAICQGIGRECDSAREDRLGLRKVGPSRQAGPLGRSVDALEHGRRLESEIRV